MWNDMGKGLWLRLGGFLYSCRRTLLLFCASVLIFGGVFALYDLEVEAVWYAAALCTVLWLVCGGVRFAAHIRRLRGLERRRKSGMLAADRLPPPDGAVEGAYQALLRALTEENARLLSQEEARREEMTDYYGIWAHQIKTPIAAMHLLLREEQSDFAGELSGELLQVEQYVEMALGYLRLDGGSGDLLFRPYELEPIVRQAVRRFAPQFIRKKLALDFGPVGLRVVTDEKWLLFCVEQVLSNAVKYTAAGEVFVYTEGETLVISDTGIGIAGEDLPRIFEKGFTGYNGRIDKKSTGIGLWLCKRVLDKLEHTISIEAAVGRGTTVRIDLARREQVLE